MKQTEPTTAEIVKALRCYEANDCDDCRYKMEFARFVACDVCEIRGIAADRLEQQDAEITRLRSLLSGRARFCEIERLERELAAAKAEICRYCNAMRKMWLRAGCQSAGSGRKCSWCEWRVAQEGKNEAD